jgi:MATE family multidrug resistance protein
MRLELAGIRAELPPMLRLAVPVVTAELGWMTMGLVDTMMVGRVSATALGAVSIGSHVFFAVAVFGMGVLVGLDFLVARAHGAGDVTATRRMMVHGLYAAVLLAVVLSAVLLALAPRLGGFGLQPDVARETEPYLRALTWSLLPLLLYSGLRRYLQAIGHVRVIMVTLVTANVINAAACWVLIFGRFGFTALGAEGAGWATCAARVYMLLAVAGYLWWVERRAPAGGGWPLRFEASRLVEIVRVGLPAALQMLLEVGVFTVATILAGRLAAEALAAHQVALGAAAFTFMVPLGISSAAAVRVGQAVGRIDPAGAARAGWTALLLGGAFMIAAAIVFVVAPRAIIRIFTDDGAVLATGVALLGVAAVFQLFDGLQVVATGALRGSGDTRTAMLANLVGHWVFGLPIGTALCFAAGWGVIGLWVGLCVGLISVAVVLIEVWRRRSMALAADYGAVGRSLVARRSSLVGDP